MVFCISNPTRIFVKQLIELVCFVNTDVVYCVQTNVFVFVVVDKHKDILSVVIISFILLTCMFYHVVIL